MKKGKVLIIDDVGSDEYFLELKNYLVDMGHNVRVRRSRVSGNFSILFDEQNYDVVLIELGEATAKDSGIEIVKTIYDEDIDTVVIILTGYGTYEQATEAINLGVFYWFDKKDLDLKLLAEVVEDACRVVPLRLQRKWLKAIQG